MYSDCCCNGLSRFLCSPLFYALVLCSKSRAVLIKDFLPSPLFGLKPASISSHRLRHPPPPHSCGRQKWHRNHYFLIQQNHIHLAYAIHFAYTFTNKRRKNICVDQIGNCAHNFSTGQININEEWIGKICELAHTHARTHTQWLALHEREIKIYCCAFDLCAVRPWLRRMCVVCNVLSVYGRPINCRTNALASELKPLESR